MNGIINIIATIQEAVWSTALERGLDNEQAEELYRKVLSYYIGVESVEELSPDIAKRYGLDGEQDV